MSETAKKSEPPPLPEYDWETARRRLVFYFSRRGMMNADDLAQETLARLVNWLRQEGNKIEGENGFMKIAYKFGHFVLLENFKAQSHTTEELPQDLSAATNRTWGLNTQEAIQLLRELLEGLSEQDRMLLLAAEETPHAELADQMGVQISTLRVWLFRQREDLSRQIQITRRRSPKRE